MNFPWRSMLTTLRPARAFAVLRAEPINTLNPVNSALRILRPTMAGRSVRTTVSTSGSSGIGKIHQYSAVFDPDGESGQGQAIVDETRASFRIELPHVPGAD